MEGSSKSVKRKIEEVDADASDEKSLGIKRFLRAPRKGRRFSSESGCLFRMVNILEELILITFRTSCGSFLPKKLQCSVNKLFKF